MIGDFGSALLFFCYFVAFHKSSDIEDIAVEMIFYVQNVKCQGCASAIQNGLNQDPRVGQVIVDVPQGMVAIETADDLPRQEVANTLDKLGYPEKIA